MHTFVEKETGKLWFSNITFYPLNNSHTISARYFIEPQINMLGLASRQRVQLNKKRKGKSCIGGTKYAANEYLPQPSKMSGVTFHLSHFLYYFFPGQFYLNQLLKGQLILFCCKKILSERWLKKPTMIGKWNNNVVFIWFKFDFSITSQVFIFKGNVVETIITSVPSSG